MKKALKKSEQSSLCEVIKGDAPESAPKHMKMISKLMADKKKTKKKIAPNTTKLAVINEEPLDDELNESFEVLRKKQYQGALKEGMLAGFKPVYNNVEIGVEGDIQKCREKF